MLTLNHQAMLKEVHLSAATQEHEVGLSGEGGPKGTRILVRCSEFPHPPLTSLGTLLLGSTFKSSIIKRL